MFPNASGHAVEGIAKTALLHSPLLGDKALALVSRVDSVIESFCIIQGTRPRRIHILP